jgi:hypothetical protein
MTAEELVARYKLGALAAHEFTTACLTLVDPADAASVLGLLPVHVLPWLKEWVDKFEPGRMISSHGGAIPTEPQVVAARIWLATTYPECDTPGPRYRTPSSPEHSIE